MILASLSGLSQWLSISNSYLVMDLSTDIVSEAISARLQSERRDKQLQGMMFIS